MVLSWGTHAHLVAALRAVSQVDAFTRSYRQMPAKMLFFASLLYGEKICLTCAVRSIQQRLDSMSRKHAMNARFDSPTSNRGFRKIEREGKE